MCNYADHFAFIYLPGVSRNGGGGGYTHSVLAGGALMLIQIGILIAGLIIILCGIITMNIIPLMNPLFKKKIYKNS